ARPSEGILCYEAWKPEMLSRAVWFQYLQMTPRGFYLRAFSERLRESRPDLAWFLAPRPLPDNVADAEILHIPHDVDPDRNFLYWRDRVDTIEIAWFLPQTRGPPSTTGLKRARRIWPSF